MIKKNIFGLGEHSLIQTTGPIPTVVKYSSQTMEKCQSHTPLCSNKRFDDTPVVIKYLQDYASPNSNGTTTESTKIVKVNVEPTSNDSHLDNNCAKSIESHADCDHNYNTSNVLGAISQNPSKVSSDGQSQNKPEVVLTSSKCSSVEKSDMLHGSNVAEKKAIHQSSGEQVKLQ